MDRKEAVQLINNLGVQFSDSLTKKSTYLVTGMKDYDKFIESKKTSKLKKSWNAYWKRSRFRNYWERWIFKISIK